MEEKIKTYTYLDFERYHAGTMPANEMHAIEKAALEDPFLSDALEGSVNAPDFKSDIAELKARIDQKEKNKIIVILSSAAQNRWWRIAALFIIIAGAGFLIYRLNFIDGDHLVVNNRMKNSAPKMENPAPFIIDSAAANNDLASQLPAKPRPASKEKTDVLKSKIKNEEDDFLPKVQDQPIPNISSTVETKESVAEKSIPERDESRTDEPAPEKMYLLKGNVTDESGAPVPFATIIDMINHKLATSADANGYFELQSPDSITLALATATGFDGKNFLLQKESTTLTVMKRNENELSTVVITSALGIKKRPQIKAQARKKSKSTNAPRTRLETSNKPFPYNANFDKYVKEMIASIPDSGFNEISGEVVLAFDVDAFGAPENIQVVKSSCTACEKLARALLAGGPGWNAMENESGTVAIQF